MINKILIAVDRSPHNKYVFDTAVSLAKTVGAKLMLLHVLSPQETEYPISPIYTYYPLVEELDFKQYRQKFAQYEKHGEEFLENLAAEANKMGVTTEYTQLEGYPGRMICQLADNWSADVILVGSRGLKGFKEMFLGSVSNYVTHHAPCSVLIVRQPIDSELDEASKEPEKKIENSSSSTVPREFLTINKIVVAIDGSRSPRMECVFNNAVALAQSTGASLMLLHIISAGDADYPLLPTYAYYSVLEDTDNNIFQEKFAEYRLRSIDLLKELTEKAIAAGVTTEYNQLLGNSGRLICEVARDWSADLIIIGSRGLKGLTEMFLGSVSNYVTHHAPCSVAIVRADADFTSESDSLAEAEEVSNNC